MDHNLHRYRKLDTSGDIFLYAKNQNYTDSKKKFIRNFTHILQRLYLLSPILSEAENQSSTDQATPVGKFQQDQLITLLKSLIEVTDTSRPYSLQSAAPSSDLDVKTCPSFIQILIFCYQQLLVQNNSKSAGKSRSYGNVGGDIKDALMQIANEQQGGTGNRAVFREFLLHLVARLYQKSNLNSKAEQMLLQEQKGQFHLMNSPETFGLLADLNPQKRVEYAKHCYDHSGASATIYGQSSRKPVYLLKYIEALLSQQKHQPAQTPSTRTRPNSSLQNPAVQSNHSDNNKAQMIIRILTEANLSLADLAGYNAKVLPDLLFVLMDPVGQEAAQKKAGGGGQATQHAIVSKASLKRLFQKVPHNLAAMKCMCQLYQLKLKKSKTVADQEKYRVKTLKTLLRYFECNNYSDISLSEFQFLKALLKSIELKHGKSLKQLLLLDSVQSFNLWKQVQFGTQLLRLRNQCLKQIKESQNQGVEKGSKENPQRTNNMTMMTRFMEKSGQQQGKKPVSQMQSEVKKLKILVEIIDEGDIHDLQTIQAIKRKMKIGLE